MAQKPAYALAADLGVLWCLVWISLAVPSELCLTVTCFPTSPLMELPRLMIKLHSKRPPSLHKLR